MSEKLLLIDGHSILFRAFFGMPISMTSPGGLHTNAIYGFLAILSKTLDEERPDYLAVAFDLPEPTFRHKLYPEYKGNRGPAPDEFREQTPVMKKLLGEMEIPIVTAEGFEADDILGTLAGEAEKGGREVRILSGDRDLLQLASDRVRIIIPRTKGGQTTYLTYGPAEVEEEFGVSPAGFIELKALMGDSSDNVPGLPGVGPKTAAKIMQTFGSIENAREHLAEVRPAKAMEAMRDHWDDLMLSRELVTIRRDAPVAFDEKAFALREIYTPAAYETFKSLGFRSLLGRFERKKEVPESGRAESEVIRVSSPEEISRMEEALSGTGPVGISLVSGEGRIFAAAVSEGERTWLFRGAGEAETVRILGRLMAACPRIYCMNAKELLKLVPAEDEGHLFDCVIAAYLIDPLKSDWGCGGIASAYLGKNVPTRAELFGKKKLSALEEENDFEERLDVLSQTEAKAALAAGPLLEKKLGEMEMKTLFDTIEMPLAYVLADMEKKGILTSREELRKYGAQLEARIGELEALIYEEAGETFNINSPKQLGQILFEKMGLPGGKKTKTGYSTAADVLEKMAPTQPIAAHVLEYRTFAKLKSTYADGLAAYIEEDGRIRTTLSQTVTATGRLSSADPNLQNIPMREELGRRIRKCFYPREGAVFVDADYSQIELRILAHMSGDEKLIEAYRQDRDIHRITASQVFHIPFEEVTDTERRNAKAVNFGIVYGISSFGLSQGLSISRGEAAEYIEKYFETYPKIKAFLDGLVAFAKEKGYAVSLFGRRRPIPELRSSNFMQRSFGERAAMNSPIQGTAADIMKIAMIRVWRRLRKELPGADLILQIHDELLVEADEKDAASAEKILREEMSRAANLSVALETDCHIGRDWYEAK